MRQRLIIFICLLCCCAARAQKIEAERTTIDVGQVEYFCPVTATYELKNGGHKPLVIDKVDTGCNCSVAEYPAGAIAAGEAFTIRVTYDARLMGHFDKMIEVQSNADNSPMMLELCGIVVEEVADYAGNYPYQLGTLYADSNTLSFDDIHLGELATRRFHIYNPTSGAVTPQIMHLPAYLTAEVSPSTVAPGRSAVVTLTLDSRFMRDYGHERTHIYLGAALGERVAADKLINVDITLLPAVQTLTDAERAVAAKLQLSATEIHLPFTDGKKKSATIEIQNVGKSRLSIYDIDILSEGFQLSLNKRLLAPSETAKLKLTTDPKHAAALSSSPRIVLITNDPDQPKVVITIDTSDTQ